MTRLLLAGLLGLGLAMPAQAATIRSASSSCAYLTAVCVVDDFLSNATASGTIGNLGWNTSGGTTSVVASETNRWGIIRRDTTATINTMATMFARSSATTGIIDPSAQWAAHWEVRLNQVDDFTISRYGLGNGTTSDPPADGIYLERLAAEAVYYCVTRASSSQTRTATTVAPTTSFIGADIVRTATAVEMYIGRVLVCTHTATIPTIMLQPIVQIKNTEAAAKTVDIDYFGLDGSVTR